MRNILTILMVTGIAFTAGLSTARADEKAQSMSDLSQKLQLQLQEANNIFTRTTKAQSDVSAKYDKALDAIAQNLK
jgi:uncharacterized protein YoxC